MGCGKTSIGPLVAERLGISYLDLDQLIEKRESRSVREIFLANGEAEFRKLEGELLAELAQRRGACVLSCGGGIVLSEKNRSLLRESFVSIWIDVPLGELLRRLEKEREERPLLAQDDYAETAASLFLKREELYESASLYRYRWKEGQDARTSADIIAGMIKG
jgi:shikimate kinase